MGTIEKACFDAEKNRSKNINESEEISPGVQKFLDECDRIINILKNDDLLEKERLKHE